MKLQFSIVCFGLSLIFSITFPGYGQAQCLVINEIMAKNDTTISDGFGEDEDWIELYNCGNNEINIGGMFFTDDTTKPWKYQIPMNKRSWTSIAPKDRMLIWAEIKRGLVKLVHILQIMELVECGMHGTLSVEAISAFVH